MLKGIFTGLAGTLCDPISSLVHPCDHLILVLKLGELGCDDTENDVLVLGKVC